MPAISLSLYLRARAVEGVAEEVAQDGVAQPLHATEAAVHPAAEVRVLVQLLERVDRRQDGVEDVLDLRVSKSVSKSVERSRTTLLTTCYHLQLLATTATTCYYLLLLATTYTTYYCLLLRTNSLGLRVLVDEHERVGHVGVSQVDQGGAWLGLGLELG